MLVNTAVLLWHKLLGCFDFLGPKKHQEVQNYFFVDESGSTSPNGDSTFILTCVQTCFPEDIRQSIRHFHDEVKRDAYKRRYLERLQEEGLHACKNHPDVRAWFFATMRLMAFRAYSVVLDKTGDYFKEMLKEKSPEQIYDFLIQALLKDRLRKHEHDLNHFCFEQNLDNPTSTAIQKRELALFAQLDSLTEKMFTIGLTQRKARFTVALGEKSEELLSLADYMGWIFSDLYNKREVGQSGIDNFELFEPKIAFVHDIAHRRYFKLRNQKIEVVDLRKDIYPSETNP